MNRRYRHLDIPLRAALSAGLLMISATAFARQDAPAADETNESQAAVVTRAERELRREKERSEAYQEALRQAEAEQREALEAMERARVELEQRAEQRQLAAEKVRARTEEERRRVEEIHRLSEAERRAEEAELAEVQRALEKAHEKLRRASREVARLHRDISRSHWQGFLPEGSFEESHRFVVEAPGRGVIGVILGRSSDEGVEVLGVSPDGPADRAGIRAGDQIVAVLDEPLAGGEQEAGEVLKQAMVAVDVGDEMELTVRRGDETFDLTLVAEKREPFTWYNYSRLPSVPPAPGAPGAPPKVFFEHIEIPEIDREALEGGEVEELLQRLRQRYVMEGDQVLRLQEGDRDVIIDISSLAEATAPEVFSELGTELAYGLRFSSLGPLTRGLRLTSMEPGLADYFGVDRGVLVLEAREDSDLQLKAGDVIMAVDGVEVNSPSEVMRALRELEPERPVDVDIMRRQQPERLTIAVAQESLGFLPDPGTARPIRRQATARAESPLPMVSRGTWQFRFGD